MTDLEKVVKGLEVCTADIPVENGIHRDDLCQKCPYHNEKYAYCFEKNKLMQDALVLLKEQEPILLENQHKPYGISTNANSPWISRCPKCGKKVEGRQTRFCKYCGQAVKWG